MGQLMRHMRCTVTTLMNTQWITNEIVADDLARALRLQTASTAQQHRRAADQQDMHAARVIRYLSCDKTLALARTLAHARARSGARSRSGACALVRVCAIARSRALARAFVHMCLRKTLCSLKESDEFMTLVFLVFTRFLVYVKDS